MVFSLHQVTRDRSGADGGAWWLIGRFVDFCLKGRGFESCSGWHIGLVLHSQLPVALWCETPLQFLCCVGSASELTWSGTMEIAWMNECVWPVAVRDCYLCHVLFDCCFFQGSRTVIHPKARIIADAGPIIIGEGNLIEEQAEIINRLA